MKEAEFNAILVSVGVMSADARKKFWNSRPTNDLIEKSLRAAAEATLREFPKIGFPDSKEST